jgi:hypothetical protein
MVMYSPWGGGGNYLARERSINGPTVYISDGRGRTWSTADMPSGAENGGWQVTEESPSLIRGNVQAYLYNKDEGTTITVSGSWVCNRD